MLPVLYVGLVSTHKPLRPLLVTESELATILTNAQAANDPYTIAEVTRARRGDATAQLACAMILGR